MKISNKLYDVLKWVAMVGLDAFAALYIALSAIWNLPCTEQIVGTTVAINVFLGTILGISSIRYNKSEAALSNTDKAE